MRLLVTGSSGYVGSHLVPALKKRGHTVVGIDRDAPGEPARAPDRFVQGDLLDEQVLERGFESEVEGVFHLAAALDGPVRTQSRERIAHIH